MKHRGLRARGSRLSVGMFTYSTAARGSVVHAAALSEALGNLGCDVTLYALNKGGEGFYRDLACRLELVHALPASGGGQSLVRQRIDELARYLGAREPQHDVFHAQDCLTANALLAADSQTAGRVFRTVHHVEQFECPYLSACQQRSILQADALCAVSQVTALQVYTQFARQPRVVGNGVMTNRVQTTPSTRIVAERQRLLAGTQGPLVLSVGGIEPRKNSLTMLEAFARLKRTYPYAVWVIVGGATVLDHNKYVATFDLKLESYAWARDVVRLGVIEESHLGAVFGSADVLLNASLQEGFGLTVLEALAAGLPVVVSDAAPFDEYLTTSSAFLVDPASSVAIAEAAIAALESSTERQLAGRGVALGHTWAAVAERTFGAYTQHLEQAQPRLQSSVSLTYA